MTSRALLIFAIGLVIGCAGPRETPDAAAPAGPVLSGTITYAEGITLPKSARIHLTVFAEPRGNETSVPVAQTRFAPSTGVPIAFELPVMATLDPTREYLLLVQIISSDILWFSNVQSPTRVLTLGAPVQDLDIVLSNELR